MWLFHLFTLHCIGQWSLPVIVFAFSPKSELSEVTIIHTGQKCEQEQPKPYSFCIRKTLNLLTDADRSNNTFCQVLWKCHWSAVDVPLKCNKPTATSTDLPQLTPPLSTVGWSKTARFTNLGGKTQRILFLKIGSSHANIKKKSLTRSLQHTRKWVFCNGANRQTNKQTDNATLWLNRSRGPIQWYCYA